VKSALLLRRGVPSLDGETWPAENRSHCHVFHLQRVFGQQQLESGLKMREIRIRSMKDAGANVTDLIRLPAI
jgi:hypothetical protein